MKILILANKPPFPPKDGGAFAIFNIAKGLAELGNYVRILAMNTSKHKIETQSLAVFDNIEITFVDVNTEINVFKAFVNYMFSILPYNATRFISKDYSNKLKEILKSETFDIVQLEGPYVGFYIPIIKKLSKARIVLREHNLEHEIWLRILNQKKNIIQKIYLKNLTKRIAKFEKKIIKLCDAILPITPRDKEQLLKEGYSQPMHLTPVGIDVPTIDLKITHQNAITYIGALDWMPNQEGLIWFIDKVWPEVIKNNPYIIFHIAGRNAPIWLEKKLTSTKNVLFHGEVDSSYNFLRAADIMIVPLFSGSGMRVKIIEAMAYGKVVITTSIGIEGIEAIHNEHLFVTDDPQKFTNYILDLIGDEDMKIKIINKAINLVKEKYDNIKISTSLNDFYRKITGNN